MRDNGELPHLHLEARPVADRIAELLGDIWQDDAATWHSHTPEPASPDMQGHLIGAGRQQGALACDQRESEPAVSIAARPASSRATGTRNGEQDT